MIDKPQDGASTLLAFVEGVEAKHTEDTTCGCSGGKYCLPACGGSCGSLDDRCSCCGCDWPCDAARGAAAIRAMLDKLCGPVTTWGSGQQIFVEVVSAGAAALGGKP